MSLPRSFISLDEWLYLLDKIAVMRTIYFKAPLACIRSERIYYIKVALKSRNSFALLSS
jgi:hypothetical protein